jgi:hypothetical protein
MANRAAAINAAGNPRTLGLFTLSA